MVEELFVKTLQGSEASLLGNNNLCGKLFSLNEPPTAFAESFKVTSAPFFVPDLNLLSCELDSLTFKVLYGVVLFWYYIKTKQNYHTFLFETSTVWKIYEPSFSRFYNDEEC